MTSLFKKAIVCTDIHFGLKNNSAQHNTDCLDFIKWACDLGKKNDCDTFFFLGDWHHNRSSVNLVTLDYSVQALEHIGKSFQQTFFIPGNHDLYYRDKRDVHGVSWASHIPNIQIVNDWFCDGDTVIAPWLVQDDHKNIKKFKGKYLFGHFELPTFMMNAQVAMPETNEVSLKEFNNFDRVFSGHFHLRQKKNNIQYIGNCFPHNFSDAGDTNRGAMILEWGKEPTFHAWKNQPTYHAITLTDLLDNADTIFVANGSYRIKIDLNITYEEASFIKETFGEKYSVRELTLVPVKSEEHKQGESGEIVFETVDQIITQELTEIKSNFYDPKLLLEIYNAL